MKGEKIGQQVKSAKRQSHLLRYWKKSCHAEPTTPLRSAIANSLLACLSGEDCLELVTKHSGIDGRLRERLLGRIIGTVSTGRPEFSDRALKSFLKALATTPYPQKATFAYCLERLYRSMAPLGRRTIVKTFLYSPQRGMRRRAYKLIKENWSSLWKSDLRRCWKQWHETECALLIVERFELKFLVKNIDQLAVDLKDGAYISRLFIRACALEPSLLMRLKNIDGITYAYVAARLGKNIPKKSARRLLEKYQYDSRLAILAWSLGEFGYWNLLTELADNIDHLEKKRLQFKLQGYGMNPELIEELVSDKANALPPAPTPATKSS